MSRMKRARRKSPTTDRPRRGQRPHEGDAGRSFELGLIGRDVADDAPGFSPRRAIPLLIIALGLALSVAALRTELLRLRYALAEATLEEQRLLDAERSLTAEKLQLRDPVRLAGRAEGLGFVSPERLTDLPDRPAADTPILAAATPPAGPGTR